MKFVIQSDNKTLETRMKPCQFNEKWLLFGTNFGLRKK